MPEDRENQLQSWQSRKNCCWTLIGTFRNLGIFTNLNRYMLLMIVSDVLTSSQPNVDFKRSTKHCIDNRKYF